LVEHALALYYINFYQKIKSLNKFNNKPIETILIDGDELAKNYKLISKNIPPDAIDKVEMIDKYEVNPLLRGLTGNRKQAMNLTLKNPNHVSAFGNLKIGAGIESKQNLTGDLFALNKASKTMILGNNNNIGVSPYEEITFDQKNTQSKDYEFDNTLIPMQIEENSLFAKPLFNAVPNSLFNNSNMATVNNSLKINSTLSAKIFSDVYLDKIRQFQKYNFLNLIYPTLSYKTTSEKQFLPSNVNLYGQVKYLTKKTQLLITGVYSNKKYEEIDSINSTLNYLSDLLSRYKRSGIGTYFTYRIDSSKVFEFSVQYVYDTKKQKYDLNQNSFRTIDSLYQTDQQFQGTNTGIRYLKSEARFLFRKKRTSPGELRLTNTLFNADLNSYLQLHTNSNFVLDPINYQNRNQSKSNKLQLFYSKELAVRKFSFGIGGGVALYANTFFLQKTTTQRATFFLPVFNVNCKYRINNKNDINLGIDNNSTNPGSVNINQNSILTSFRSFTSRIPWYRNVPYLQSNLTYIFRDINNGESLIFSWLYLRQFSSEVSNIRYFKDFDYYTTRYSSNNQDQNTLFLKYDKYASRIKSSFSIKQSFTWFTRPIEVNSLIVSNRNFVYSLNASFKPYFNSVFNITGGVSLMYNQDISSRKSTYQVGPYINATAILSNKFSIGTNSSHFSDNFAIQKNNYWFISSSIWYTIRQSRLDMKLTINNILNTNATFSGSRNDVYSQFGQQKMLPRFGLIEFLYKL